jgi:hypothetical protein
MLKFQGCHRAISFNAISQSGQIITDVGRVQTDMGSPAAAQLAIDNPFKRSDAGRPAPGFSFIIGGGALIEITIPI